MSYAQCVGRIGALAVALGIGVAVAGTPGVAWAEGSEDSPSPSPAASEAVGEGGPASSTAPSSVRHDPGQLIRRSIERTTDNVRKVVAGAVQSSGGAITSTNRSGASSSSGNVLPILDPQGQLKKAQSPKVVQKSTPSVANDESNLLRSVVPPHWRAPKVQPLDTKRPPGPAAKTVDDVKPSVQQTIATVIGTQPGAGSKTLDRSSISILDAPTTQNVRTPSLAPIKLVSSVLNTALAPFLNTAPGQPAPQNPVLWAVLGWVRRQVQDTPIGKVVFNRTPEITTPEVVDNHDGTFTITPSADDFDPDGDSLNYTASNGADGTIEKNADGTFTYTVTDPGQWDKSDTITLTASDEDTYPHIHGLEGLFSPGGGHTAMTTVNIVGTKVVESAPPMIPDGASAAGSPAFGSDGKTYQPVTMTNQTGEVVHAISVSSPDGTPETVEIPGDLVGGLVQGTDGTIYQTSVDNNQTVVTAFGPEGVSTTVVDGTPDGPVVVGKNGAAYQVITDTVNQQTVVAIFGRSSDFSQVLTLASKRSSGADVALMAATIPSPAQIATVPGIVVATGADGQPVDPLVIGDDGTAYLLAVDGDPSNLYSINSGRVAAFRPDGSTTITPLAGTPLGMPVAGPNGVSYQIMYDLSDPYAPVARIAVIDSAGNVTYKPVTGFPRGIAARPDGTVYVATSDTFDPTTAKTSITVLGSAAPLVTYDGLPSQLPEIGSDGTLYQPSYRLDPATQTAKTYVAVIRQGQAPVVREFDGLANTAMPMVTVPGGDSYLTLIDGINTNGTNTKVVRFKPDGTFTETTVLGQQNGPIVVAPDGTAYLTTAYFNNDPAVNDWETKVTAFGSSGVTTVTIPGSPGSQVVVGPDGTAAQSSYNPATEETTLVVIRPSGAQTYTVDGLSNGSFAVGSDGTVALSTAVGTYDDETQTFHFVTRVLVVKPAGTSTTTVLDGVLPAAGPSITPNGDIYQTVGPEWEGPHTTVRINP